MGPSIVMCFWSLLLLPIGLAIGAILSFGLPALLRKLRKLETPAPAPRRSLPLKLAIMVLTSAVLVPMAVCFGAYLMEKDLNDYWASRGAWDWWRMPLRYPYDLIAVGSLEKGAITNWETGTQYVDGIERFALRGTYVLGRISGEMATFLHLPGAWFSFDWSTGQVTWYAGEQDYARALRDLGFKDPVELRTVEENLRGYWHSH